jgi:predicted NUDIX family phosphoesterase
VTREDRVFLFRRSSRGGEARLHHKLSVGVGGHINPEGVPPADLVEAGLLRELQEELIFDTPFHYRPVGLINDDQTAVGRVHMGIVYLVEVERESVRVRETEILEGGFVPVGGLPDLVSGMETWSQLVVSGLFGV